MAKYEKSIATFGGELDKENLTPITEEDLLYFKNIDGDKEELDKLLKHIGEYTSLNLLGNFRFSELEEEEWVSSGKCIFIKRENQDKNEILTSQEWTIRLDMLNIIKDSLPKFYSVEDKFIFMEQMPFENLGYYRDNKVFINPYKFGIALGNLIENCMIPEGLLTEEDNLEDIFYLKELYSNVEVPKPYQPLIYKHIKDILLYSQLDLNNPGNLIYDKEGGRVYIVDFESMGFTDIVTFLSDIRRIINQIKFEGGGGVETIIEGLKTTNFFYKMEKIGISDELLELIMDEDIVFKELGEKGKEVNNSLETQSLEDIRTEIREKNSFVEFLDSKLETVNNGLQLLKPKEDEITGLKKELNNLKKEIEELKKFKEEVDNLEFIPAFKHIPSEPPSLLRRISNWLKGNR